MIPSDPHTVRRRVAVSKITQRDRLDDRLSCLKAMFGTNIGLNGETVDWCPDDIPPTTSEAVGWLWFCRPDLCDLLYMAVPDDLRELMVAYHHDRLDDWWKQFLQQGETS